MDMVEQLRNYTKQVEELSGKIDSLNLQEKELVKQVKALDTRLGKLEKTPIDTKLDKEDKKLLENIDQLKQLLEGTKKIEVRTVLDDADRRLIDEFPDKFKTASSYARQLKTIRWATVYLLLALFLNWAFWPGSPAHTRVMKIWHSITAMNHRGG